MRSNSTVLLIGLFLSSPLFAREDVQFTASGDEAAVWGALQVVGLAIGEEKTVPKIPKDEIHGKCEYDRGWCPGAVLTLKDTDGNIIDKLTISAVEGFKFLDLKKNNYTLEISYPRFGLKPVSQSVHGGTEILITLKRGK